MGRYPVCFRPPPARPADRPSPVGWGCCPPSLTTNGYRRAGRGRKVSPPVQPASSARLSPPSEGCRSCATRLHALGQMECYGSLSEAGSGLGALGVGWEEWSEGGRCRECATMARSHRTCSRRVRGARFCAKYRCSGQAEEGAMAWHPPQPPQCHSAALRWPSWPSRMGNLPPSVLVALRIEQSFK